LSPNAQQPLHDLVTLGECLVALRAVHPGPLSEADRFERVIAGAEANVAVALSRLGLRTAFIGRVGDDGFGDAVVRRLSAENVDVSHVTRDNSPTGIQIRETRGFGSSEAVYYRKESAGSRLCPEDVLDAREAIRRSSWLHITGITPALSNTARLAVHTAVEIAFEAGVKLSFDVNFRRKLWPDKRSAREALEPLLPNSSVVFAGLDETELLTRIAEPEAAARQLLSRLPDDGIVVVKLGEKGALALDRRGSATLSAAPPATTVIDPIGAGDAFAAGFLSALLERQPVQFALARGNLVAAFVLSSYGDMTGLPTRDELNRLQSETISEPTRR
jgi:2-dehydro-3-deoxygluconokinase